MNSNHKPDISFPHLGPGYESVLPLFMTGCERSGSTALLSLLNHDQRIVMGKERYKFVCNELKADHHFQLEVFCQPRPEETNALDEKFYSVLHERWRKGGLKYIGDKNPLYFRHLKHLDSEFSEARYLFLVRDLDMVAASYNARARNPQDVNWPEHKNYKVAVKFWNESAENIRKLYFETAQDRIYFIKYEHLFSGQKQYLEDL